MYRCTRDDLGLLWIGEIFPTNLHQFVHVGSRHEAKALRFLEDGRRMMSDKGRDGEINVHVSVWGRVTPGSSRSSRECVCESVGRNGFWDRGKDARGDKTLSKPHRGPVVLN